jgi:hypothetical protein
VKAVKLCFPAANAVGKSVRGDPLLGPVLPEALRALAYAVEVLCDGNAGLVEDLSWHRARLDRIDEWIDPTGLWDSRPPAGIEDY